MAVFPTPTFKAMAAATAATLLFVLVLALRATPVLAVRPEPEDGIDNATQFNAPLGGTSLHAPHEGGNEVVSNGEHSSESTASAHIDYEGYPPLHYFSVSNSQSELKEAGTDDNHAPTAPATPEEPARVVPYSGADALTASDRELRSFEGYPALRYDSVGSEDFAEGEESSMGYEELEPAARRICCPYPGHPDPCCRTGQSVRGTHAAAGAGSVP